MLATPQLLKPFQFLTYVVRLAPTSTIHDLIFLKKVNATVLKKVIEWCQHHRADPPASTDDDSDSRKKTTDIEEWDQKFMQVDQEMLFEIILVRARSTKIFN